MKPMTDEELIAALLYYHLEDFAEAVASDGFTRVIKAAFRRLGLKYETFGPKASVFYPGSPQNPPHHHLNGVDITALLDEAREAIREGES